MTLRRAAFALVFLAGLAFRAPAQEECRLLTISDTPPLDRIEIDPLDPDDDKGVKFSGTATLFLDDGTPIALAATRKLRKKQGTWKYKLKTLKHAKPKAKVVAELGGDPEQVLKFKLKFKGEEKVKLKDPTKVTVGACATTSFTVGPAGGSFDAAEGKVSFFFPPGAVTEDTTITVTPVDPPAGTDFVAGSVYRFGPDMSFLQPVDLTVSYDPAEITGDENELVLAKFLEDDENSNEQQWHTTGVDTVNDTVTGYVTGFSTSGLGGQVPLLPPADLTATVNADDSVTLTWMTTENAVLFERARMVGGGPCSPNSTSPSCIEVEPGVFEWNGLQPPVDSDYVSLGYHSATPATYTDFAPRSQAGVYYYRIRSSRGLTLSSPSSPVRAVIFGPLQLPPAPDYVHASPSVCGGIAVYWAHVLEAETYDIFRSDGGAPYDQVATVIGTSLFHVDTKDLVPSEEYRYRVFAHNSTGSSAGTFSETVTNSDATFSVALTQYRPTIEPGESAKIDVVIDRFAGPSDITLSATVDSSRVTASFSPETTSGDSQLTLEVDEDAPLGLRVTVEVAAEADGGGTPCPIPDLILSVDQPPPPPPPAGPTLLSLDPSVVTAGNAATIFLNGTGFADGAAVFVDDMVQEAIVLSEEEMEAFLSPLSAGTHKVKVKNPDGAESNELDLLAD